MRSRLNEIPKKSLETTSYLGRETDDVNGPSISTLILTNKPINQSKKKEF